MEFRNVLLLGGSGFIGTAVADLLYSRGCRITVPTRRLSRAMPLTMFPTVDLVETDVHDEAALARLVAGQDAVINLVGILHGGHGRPYGKAFSRAHVELPKKLAAACVKAGVRRVLHVSALNADPHGPSQYLRSKGDGETALRMQGDRLDLTIFRPSVVFGADDSFLNLFARLLRSAPFIPLGRPDARFQPVYVWDVARAIVGSLDHPESIGQAYPLVGPKIYSLRELVEFVGTAIGRPRPVIGLPEPAARLMAMMMELLPNPPMSADNLDSMKLPAICPNCPLPFGLEAHFLAALAPEWLAQRTPRGRYVIFRNKARR